MAGGAKSTTNLGKEGEEAAVTWLQNQGYLLVGRNFRHGRAEIDLIAKKDEVLVFIEVKRRKSEEYGRAEAFVSAAQEERILQAAAVYQETHDWFGPVRFDILAIEGSQMTVRHFQDALG